MLKKLRLSRKLSQSELAARVGISQSYLSKLENLQERSTMINTLLVKNLSEVLNVSPILLLIYFYSPHTKINLKCLNCSKNKFIL
ncbi:Helix-turn-helix [Clostridium amylolyticum]|uniref:Helix-turn-helix n=1 Tax=Clostridium amylolyticum TaxID=1121298 RepID=A0A1M6KXC8_9CLOT|nr:Helix-turn-helix [Clostridium amylolyticum]